MEPRVICELSTGARHVENTGLKLRVTELERISNGMKVIHDQELAKQRERKL